MSLGTRCLLCLAAPLALIAGCSSSDTADAGTSPPRARGDGLAVVLAAPGRVEGLSEVIEVGVAMDGVLENVLVEEGQRVPAGEPLALLVCDDVRASLAAARAEAERTRQELRRVERGARDEERREAAAATTAARAVLKRAESEFERRRALAQADQIVSQEALDRAERDAEVARAELRAAEERERLVKAGPLPEESARAAAEVRAAEERVRVEAGRVEKCTVRAPRVGTVLRTHMHAGEQVSLAVPRPVVSLADLSRQRVRAEIDERDVGRVRLGQRALVSAEALGDERLAAEVVEVGAMMGRRDVRSGDPAEKADRDVREVVVQLGEVHPHLVVGLRVTVFFIATSMTTEGSY